MYREFVLSTRPYSYYTLSGSTGNQDILDRGPTLTPAYYSDPTTPEFYQQHVPGYPSSIVYGANYTPDRSFGVTGTENKAFSYDLWNDSYYLIDSGTYEQDSMFIIEQGSNFLVVDSKNIVVEFGATDPTKTVGLSYYNEDPWEAKHIGVIWGVSSATLFINGLAVDFVSVPTGFEFSNTTAAMTITSGGSSSHFAFYDRIISDEEIAEKYLYKDQLTSHAEACYLDGGDVIEMWGPQTNYTDIVIDDEFGSAGSLNKNIDSRGWHAPLEVDKFVLSTGTLSQTAAHTVLGAGQYLSIPAAGYLSTGSWAISIETNDDNSRAGNEYLFTIFNDTETLEAYVTSGGSLVVKRTELLSDGTSDIDTFTYDTTVVTNGRKFVFVYRDGRLFVKSGATGTVLNTVSAATSILTSISITPETFLYIGTSPDKTGNAVQAIKNVYLHRASISDDLTLGDFDFYQNEYYSRGYWPLNNVSGLRGSAAQKLITQPYIVEDSAILNAYMINKKSYNSDIILTTSEGTFTTREPIAAVPSSVIPYSGVVGVDLDAQIVSLELDHKTENLAGRTYSGTPGALSTTLRLFTNRRADALGSQSYVNLTGAGACWMNGENTTTMMHNKYAGTYFESGSVGGPVEDPLVDGSTIRYEYRAFEFLMYIDGPTVNTGNIISIYNGTTEYYFRVGTTLIETNFSTCKLNGVTTTDYTELMDKWIHVYIELPSLIQDRQVYVGKAYNGASYANGIGIKNLAMYDAALSSTKQDEHFQCFTGRFYSNVNVVDSVSVAENAQPLLYSVAWTNNVVPG